MSLAPVPSLDDLAEDPSRAAGLPPAVARTLMFRALAALAALAAHPAADGRGAPEVLVEADRLLNVEEAAARLGFSTDWLYRHAATLPFTVRPGRRALRFSSHGIDRYIRSRADR